MHSVATALAGFSVALAALAACVILFWFRSRAARYEDHTREFLLAEVARLSALSTEDALVALEEIASATSIQLPGPLAALRYAAIANALKSLRGGTAVPAVVDTLRGSLTRLGR